MMKVFGDLKIQAGELSIETLVTQMEAIAPLDWKRNKELEERVNRMSLSPSFCFHYNPANKELPSADVWLAERESGEIWVPNILPSEKSELSRDEYNEILSRFNKDIVKPLTGSLNVTVEKTKTEVDLEDLVNPSVATALRAFSALANKSTGSSHPLDRERWNEFIILHHKAGNNLSVDLLIRWLKSDGWDEDSAVDLGIQFERGRDLLKQFAKS